MSSREHFEAWYLENWGHTEDHHETLFERSPDDESEYYRFGVRMAHQAWQAATSAMEAKCAALAAENVRLKDKGRELLDEACKVYEKFNTTINPETGDFMDGQTLHEFQFVLDVDTSATDAFLAEVRAQGADAVAEQHRRNYEELKPINVFFAEEHKEAQGVAEFVAAQLRQETAQ